MSQVARPSYLPSVDSSHGSGYNLRDYQKHAVAFATNHPHCYLALDPGLGKTRVALASYPGADLLVVAPAAVRDARVWQTEAERVGWAGQMEVVSYHGLAKRAAAKKSKPQAIVFDEAHRMKNRKAQWFDPAKRLVSGTEGVALLSGTPVPNVATELWAQLSLIKPMPAYWTWVKQWFKVVPTRYSQWTVPGPLLNCVPECEAAGKRNCAHWHEFQEANMGDIWLRQTRDEVLTDLPPLTGADHPVLVPMTSYQRDVYRSLKSEFLASLADGTELEALTHSEQFSMLHRFSSVVPTGADGRFEGGKLQYLREMLGNISRPVVLVCWFRDTAEALHQLVSDDLQIPSLMLSAKTSRKGRADAVRQFQTGKAPVLIGSLGVISEGITLTAADRIVMVERSWVPGVNEQAIRRLHRMGQQNPVLVEQLLTDRSVDRYQWDSLYSKRDHISRVLTRDQVASLI